MKKILNLPISAKFKKIIEVDFSPQEVIEGASLVRTASDYIKVDDSLCMKTGKFQGTSEALQQLSGPNKKPSVIYPAFLNRMPPLIEVGEVH